ncbi:MAG TPA: hypothetical protein VMW10_07105, partial [Alphaproteobacteria bacterium]|nr:hypothetical protein [Alphaproteobacteria bacterium]
PKRKTKSKISKKEKNHSTKRFPTPVKVKKNTVKKEKLKSSNRKRPLQEIKNKVSTPHKHSSPLKKTKIEAKNQPGFLQDPIESPVTKEKKCFKEARDLLVTLKAPVDSPVARPLLLKSVKGTDHFKKLYIEGMVVYYPNNLIRWDDFILTKNKNKLKWETNFERALRGAAVVAYKGISERKALDELDAPTVKSIRKLQRAYAVQVHHLTQKGIGTEEDPYVLLTQTCHMGTNARYIIEKKSNGSIQVVHSGLSTEEAETLCCTGQETFTNLLHFRRGKSLIPRSKFNDDRTKIWKTLAKMHAQLAEDVQPPKKAKHPASRKSLFTSADESD